MRSYLFTTILILALLAGTASAGWFGANKSEDSVTTLKKDAMKTFESAKTVGKEKTAAAKAKAKEAEDKARSAAKEASEKAKKTSAKAKEEGKGLIGDIKTRFNRLFGGAE